MVHVKEIEIDINIDLNLEEEDMTRKVNIIIINFFILLSID